jgi:hypothetical protein
MSLLALGELVDFNSTYPRICGHTKSAWVAITSHCQKEPSFFWGRNYFTLSEILEVMVFTVIIPSEVVDGKT